MHVNVCEINCKWLDVRIINENLYQYFFWIFENDVLRPSQVRMNGLSNIDVDIIYNYGSIKICKFLGGF